MKPTLYASQLFVLLLVLGCQGPENDKNAPSGSNNANTETMPEPDTKDRYLADVSKLVAEMLKTVEQVSNEESAAEALAKLKQMEPRAKALGKRVEELKAAAKKSGNNEDVVGYLQENGKTRLAASFKKLEETLGKSKTSSEYPELWESAVGLINMTKSN